MKINTLSTLIIGATLLVFASCNKEEVTNPPQNGKIDAPAMRGTIVQFSDTNPAASVKAGVVEEFQGFEASGERFYWQNGDLVKLIFYNEVGSPPDTVIYRAVVAPGDGKKNTCHFETVEPVQLPAGTYFVGALAPAEPWLTRLDENDVPNVQAVVVGENYTQDDTTSTHLAPVLFMVAISDNVVIEDGNQDIIKLSFEQLTSVVRCRVTDSVFSAKSDFTEPLILDYVKLYSEDGQLFIKDAFIDGESLTMEPTEFGEEGDGDFDYLDSIRVNVNQPFKNKNGYREFDVFVPVLPTEASGQKLIIEARIRYYEGGVEKTSIQFFDTENGLSFDSGGELAFMGGGFKGGYSYVFYLTTKE